MVSILWDVERDPFGRWNESTMTTQSQACAPSCMWEVCQQALARRFGVGGRGVDLGAFGVFFVL